MLNIYEFTGTINDRREQAREMRNRMDINPETFVENFLVDYETFNGFHTASETAYLVNTEECRDIGDSLNPDDLGYVAPSRTQLQQVSGYGRKAFPNHPHYVKALEKLAEKDLDRDTTSNLISNLKRLSNQPTEGQRKALMKYWNHERFSDLFKPVIREYGNLKTSREEVSRCLDKCKRLEDKLIAEYLTESELKEITTLYYRATGRRAEADFSMQELREYFTASSFETLKRDLNEFIICNEREKQRRYLEEKRRDNWFDPTERSAKYVDCEELTEEQIQIMTRKWDEENTARQKAGKPMLTFAAWRDKERIRNSNRPRSEKMFLLQRIECNAIIRYRRMRKIKW